MFPRLLLLGGILAGLPLGAAFADERPVVVELFTSQGCSSCPPANAFLSELAKDRTDVLPLGFHVTYWDRLGWTDPFSLRAATARQARYGDRFGDGSYTPEIVVDGAVGLVGSHRAAVQAAIETAKAQPLTATDVAITRSESGLAVEVGQGTGTGRLLLIGFDHEQVTRIPRGENGGHTFVESNVVRSVDEIGKWSGRKLRIDTRVPDGQDAAVLLEAPDGRIIGASRLPAQAM